MDSTDSIVPAFRRAHRSKYQVTTPAANPRPNIGSAITVRIINAAIPHASAAPKYVRITRSHLIRRRSSSRSSCSGTLSMARAPVLKDGPGTNYAEESKYHQNSEVHRVKYVSYGEPVKKQRIPK